MLCPVCEMPFTLFVFCAITHVGFEIAVQKEKAKGIHKHLKKRSSLTFPFVAVFLRFPSPAYLKSHTALKFKKPMESCTAKLLGIYGQAGRLKSGLRIVDRAAFQWYESQMEAKGFATGTWF